MSPPVMQGMHHPTIQGSQLNQALCCYLLNSRQAIRAILHFHKNLWNSEQMCCDTEGVTNNQTNLGFPFGIDERILIVFKFSKGSTEPALTNTRFLCMFEKFTAFHHLIYFFFYLLGSILIFV